MGYSELIPPFHQSLGEKLCNYQDQIIVRPIIL